MLTLTRALGSHGLTQRLLDWVVSVLSLCFLTSLWDLTLSTVLLRSSVFPVQMDRYLNAYLTNPNVCSSVSLTTCMAEFYFSFQNKYIVLLSLSVPRCSPLLCLVFSKAGGFCFVHLTAVLSLHPRCLDAALIQALIMGFTKASLTLFLTIHPLQYCFLFNPDYVAPIMLLLSAESSIASRNLHNKDWVP